LYSPSLGRWISRDPAEEAAGLNSYAFVLNHPCDDFDILGNAPRGHHPGLTEVYKRMLALGGGPGAEIIKLWTLPFNNNHKWKHHLYSETVWHQVEQLMAEKGFTDLNAFFRAMNKDVSLTLEFAGRVLENPATRAYNSLVSRAGISAAAEGLGRAVGRVAKVGVKAFPVLAALGVTSQARDFEREILDYGRSEAVGDWGMNLLDAAIVTSRFQNMTGNYYASLYLLDSLLQ
jgi:hypothetical protein